MIAHALQCESVKEGHVFITYQCMINLFNHAVNTEIIVLQP